MVYTLDNYSLSFPETLCLHITFAVVVYSRVDKLSFGEVFIHHCKCVSDRLFSRDHVAAVLDELGIYKPDKMTL